MPASQLYQNLVVNRTKNMVRKELGVPDSLMHLIPMTKLKPVDERQFDQQMDLDAAMWYGAVATGPCSRTILRIFHMFWAAGVMYWDGERWADWSANRRANVASLLSHGGRVMVQIPSIQQGGDKLWPWLNADGDIAPRSMATHGLTVSSKPKSLLMGRQCYLTEDKGWGTAVWGALHSRHFAFNPALGGRGNCNPFSATNDDRKGTFTPVRGDGCNGHVYVCYLPPGEKHVGGLLIGCENVAYGMGGNPHTAAGHGISGKANKLSAFGGKKWSELGTGPHKSYGGMVCDLTDRDVNLDWLTGQNLFAADFLDGATNEVPTAVAGALRAG